MSLRRQQTTKDTLCNTLEEAAQRGRPGHQEGFWEITAGR